MKTKSIKTGKGNRALRIVEHPYSDCGMLAIIEANGDFMRSAFGGITMFPTKKDAQDWIDYINEQEKAEALQKTITRAWRSNYRSLR